MQDPLFGYVRVNAVCRFLHNERVLAIDGFDSTKRQRFSAPVGGRVEFGETSREAIVREVREARSEDHRPQIRQLGVSENLFTFDGESGHEIVFVYDAQLADPHTYNSEQIRGLEGSDEFTAHRIDPFAPEGERPLYAEGLLDLISRGDP
jgi:ADP-ribose pyrophosphatase YjhB (NUDIX family)